MRFFNSTFLHNILFAIITALFVDFIAFNKFLSTVVHLFLLIYLIYLIFKNHHRAIMMIIGYGILIPIYPRSILDDVDNLILGNLQYTTFYSLGFGPLNVYFLLLFLLLARIIHLNNLNVKSSKNINLFIVVFYTLIVASFFYNFNVQSEYINLSINYFSTIKFIVYLIIGFFLFKNYKGSIHINFFLNIAIILGMRVILFLLFDFLYSPIPKLDFALQPYITLPFIFLVLKNKIELSPINFLFIVLSLLYPSRLFILISILSLGFFALSTKFSILFFKLMISIFFLFILSGVVLYNFNERIFNFFLWKLEVLNTVTGTGEISGSGGVRILELKNILNKISRSPINLLIGEGPFGYYNFDKYPLVVDGVIDSKSFPYDQIVTNKYFTVHNFISFLLLKLGFVGLFLYICLASTILFIKNKSARMHNQLSFLPLLLTYYFNPINSLFLGILISNKVNYESD